MNGICYYNTGKSYHCLIHGKVKYPHLKKKVCQRMVSISVTTVPDLTNVKSISTI